MSYSFQGFHEKQNPQSEIDCGLLHDILVGGGGQKSPHVVQDGVDVRASGPNRDAGLDFQDRIGGCGDSAREGQRARQLPIGPHHAGKRDGRFRSSPANGQFVLDRTGVIRTGVTDEVGPDGVGSVRLCVDG